MSIQNMNVEKSASGREAAPSNVERRFLTLSQIEDRLDMGALSLVSAVASWGTARRLLAAEMLPATYRERVLRLADSITEAASLLRELEPK